MIDAASGGSEARRSDDGLSDASDSGYEGAGEFASVINDMNNNAALTMTTMAVFLCQTFWV